MSGIRPSVMKMAEAMEAKLQENNHKKGWDNCWLGYLLKRLREETAEFETALFSAHAVIATDGTKEAVAAALSDCRKEAADMANFSMMLIERIETLGSKCLEPNQNKG